jgi:hypothetical protein
MNTAYCARCQRLERFVLAPGFGITKYDDAPARAMYARMGCGNLQRIVRPLVTAAPYGGEDQSHSFMTSESVG